jgi:integrase
MWCEDDVLRTVVYLVYHTAQRLSDCVLLTLEHLQIVAISVIPPR